MYTCHTPNSNKMQGNINNTILQWLRNGLTCASEAIVWAFCFHATNWTQDPEDERWFTHIGIGTALLLIVTCFIPNNAYSRTARRDEVVANAMKTGLAFGILAYAIYLNIFLPLACFWFCIALAIERLILNSWFVHYALHHKEHSIIICTEDGLWQQEVLLQNTYGLALTRLEQPSAQSLKEYLITHPETKSIYIEPSILSTTELEEVAHVCYEHSLTFHLLPQAVPALNQAMQSEYRGTVNVLSTTNPPLQSPFNMAIKRLTDILFSLIILLTIFPFVAFIAYIFIKKQSRGPIFKIQQMYGMDGKGFQCITFRTQHYNAESASLEDANNPTYFPFGKFLIASRLELLPQFINVLFGTMSVVGSQIMNEKYYNNYKHELKQLFASEYQLKAGIASYRFASQARGNSKADVWYYRNWGFWLDIRIMFHHIISLIKKSNNKRISYI